MKVKFYYFFAVLTLSTLMMGCSSDNQTDNAKMSEKSAADSPSQPKLSQEINFAGCYAIAKNTPAIIKINQVKDSQNKDTHAHAYTMQMKEPTPDKLWDDAEPLIATSLDDAWQYYANNSYDIQKSYLTATIKRADNLLVLSAIDPAVKNINPLIDSDYIVYAFGQANPIYQVACDSVPVDMLGTANDSGDDKTDKTNKNPSKQPNNSKKIGSGQ